MDLPAPPLTALMLSNRAQRPGPHGDEPGPDPGLFRRGLEARGVRVRERRLHGFPLNPLAGRGTFYAGFDPARALRVLLAERDADVVVSVGESNIALLLAAARTLRFRPRIVLREISAPGWARRDRIVKYVVPRVDGILTLTRHQQLWARRRFPGLATLHDVGFAIDEAFFRPQDVPEQPYVLAVGDDAGRDYPSLVEACRELPYRLLLRTDTPPPMPAALRDRVQVLERQSFADLRALYAAAALVVVPLHQVDSPSGITALFEGMAMGRAVLTTDTGYAPEIVRHGENGWLSPPGDAAGLRQGVAQLMADAALRRRLGEAARLTIERDHSYEAYIGRFAAALRSIVQGD
jgi:glycosyltransferase involved in cell wall biosynthesis